MADGVAVYISIMKDSLLEKEEVLEGILAQTKEQERILEQSEIDTDAFERTLAQKGKLRAIFLQITGHGTSYTVSAAVFRRIFQRIDFSLPIFNRLPDFAQIGFCHSPAADCV